MRLVSKIILIILTFLAVSSGIAKILLFQQDVDFFGKYGFSNPLLIAYGSVQLIGGILLPLKKTRFAGAAIVAITFLVSLALLTMDGNMGLSIVTMVAILLLAFVMTRSRGAQVSKS